MYQLEFARVYDYSREDEICVFGTEIAQVLGLDLTSGIRQRFSNCEQRL